MKIETTEQINDLLEFDPTSISKKWVLVDDLEKYLLSKLNQSEDIDDFIEDIKETIDYHKKGYDEIEGCGKIMSPKSIITDVCGETTHNRLIFLCDECKKKR